MIVYVTICERGAIYVNESRITTRATKWGARATLAEFECPQEDVARKVKDMGFRGYLRNIDTAPYDAQARGLIEGDTND